VTMTIDEKNQRALAIAEEVLEDRMNNTQSLEASFINMLTQVEEHQNNVFHAAHLLATFFYRCQVIKGAQGQGEAIDTNALFADEAESLHRQLDIFLGRYLRPLVVKYAIEQVGAEPP